MNVKIVFYVLLCITVFASSLAAAQDDAEREAYRDLRNNFNFIPVGNGNYWVACGLTGPAVFASSGQEGDWAFWEIKFSSETEGYRFEWQPFVFVSLYSYSNDVPAIVGQARNVRPDGFTLAARNSDTLGGYSARFAWIAIGQGRIYEGAE
jgi:hypothetical protein